VDYLANVQTYILLIPMSESNFFNYNEFYFLFYFLRGSGGLAISDVSRDAD
jgi:hypothetical protein